MFCYQCQETAKGTGCTIRGVCGKKGETADLQDLLIFILKGISYYGVEADKRGIADEAADRFITESMFSTITNANFDEADFLSRIAEGLAIRESLKETVLRAGVEFPGVLPGAATWYGEKEGELRAKAESVGVLNTDDEDVRSLRELIIYGVKGIAAYASHALNLGYRDPEIFAFMRKALAATLDDGIGVGDLVALSMECGSFGVKTMELLDKANTETYGDPEITKVDIGVRANPGILVSGHDLKDLEQLLEQTAGTGVDVYTHGEMLPAQYYPAFKKFDHFAGNYGNSWWKQTTEFESFNGPILMTTNCIVPPKDSYKDRVFMTGVVGFDGLKRIEEHQDGTKDFREIIELAKTCPPPTEIETGELVGGFAHATIESLAGTIVDAVKAGKIKRFFVMAGCDGRMKNRTYYTEFASALPKDTVILTAGCAKYRYNKLPLGDIDGIPRVLDAGQCNDSYSLVVAALKLKEAFGLDDVNQLPLSFNIAWYEQKAVIVLLALLSLVVKNIHVGPTLPAFLSPNVVNVLVEKFNLGGITNVEDDVAMFMETV